MLNMAQNVAVFLTDMISYTSLRIVQQREWAKN
jgi:hypothetical protein